MVGKDSHRPEGKAGLDPSQRRMANRRADTLSHKPESAPDPARYDAEEQRGGSRPGVPRLMKGELPAKSDDE